MIAIKRMQFSINSDLNDAVKHFGHHQVLYKKCLKSSEQEILWESDKKTYSWEFHNILYIIYIYIL